MEEKKSKLGKIIFAIIAIAAFVTNPSPKDFDNYCFKQSRNMSTPIARFEFEAIGRDNYYLFSIYKAKVIYSGYIYNEKTVKYIGFFNGFGKLSDNDDK